MNNLTTFSALCEENPAWVDVYWMTGNNKKGIIRAQLDPELEDTRICAELAVIRYLLEDRNVAGHDKSGAGLCLTVSCGAIRKLALGDSAKEHLAGFAQFLRTRFLGCGIRVVHRLDRSFEGVFVEREVLTVHEPLLDTLYLHGVGEVVITAHAVAQYVLRFGRKPERAWRELRSLAASDSVGPFMAPHRGALADLKHRRPGKLFLHPGRRVIFVVVPPGQSHCRPALVTVYTHGD
jgi:hypothetical protein